MNHAIKTVEIGNLKERRKPFITGRKVSKKRATLNGNF